MIITIAIISDNWQNNISKEEYLHNYKNIKSIDHIRNSQDIKELNNRSQITK